MSSPRLTVIIPGYNTPEAWWRRCLDSVRGACGPNDEIICVDDGSSIDASFLNKFMISLKLSKIKLLHHLEQQNLI